MLKDLNNEKLEKIIEDAQEELEHRTKGATAEPESPFDVEDIGLDEIICRSMKGGNGMHFKYQCSATDEQITEHAMATIDETVKHLKKTSSFSVAMFALKVVSKLQKQIDL